MALLAVVTIQWFMDNLPILYSAIVYEYAVSKVLTVVFCENEK